VGNGQQPGNKQVEKEHTMSRKFLLAGVVALSLVAFGAAESYAQVRPLPQLNPNRQPLGLTQYALQVIQVLPGGSASIQGIEPGDVIVSVNNIPVRSITDLNVLLGQSGRVATLGVIDGRTGGLNQVLVYPIAGRIGVITQQVPLGSTPTAPCIQPFNPGILP